VVITGALEPAKRYRGHAPDSHATQWRTVAGVMDYRAMTLAELAGFLIKEPLDEVRWKLVWEFLEEHRWEPPDRQPGLVAEEPPATGDERWDALLAALAEHLNAKLDLAPPSVG
jgi:hypothetical protein